MMGCMMTSYDGMTVDFLWWDDWWFRMMGWLMTSYDRMAFDFLWWDDDWLLM